jgi:acyl-CoA thioesterase I
MGSPALYLASGDSLYPGTALLLIVIAISPFLKHLWLMRFRNVAAWVGLALIVMASPPFVWGIDAIFLAAFAFWMLALNLAEQHRTWARVRTASAALLTGMLLLFPAAEIRHRKMPKIMGPTADHLVVMGDSISSGIDLLQPPWPAVMQQMTCIAVKNLARPGAQVIDAESMVKFVMPEDRVVLIEIGGNDLLGGAPSYDFESALNHLLLKLSTPQRTIVMFELPLLPHKIAFGQIQRRLATKYGVWLIPKRYFVDVLGGADATLDGLHLSHAGAQRMAALVAKALSPVLNPPAAASPCGSNANPPAVLN